MMLLLSTFYREAVPEMVLYIFFSGLFIVFPDFLDSPSGQEIPVSER